MQRIIPPFLFESNIVLDGRPKKKRQGGITRKVMEAGRLENIISKSFTKKSYCDFPKEIKKKIMQI